MAGPRLYGGAVSAVGFEHVAPARHRRRSALRGSTRQAKVAWTYGIIGVALIAAYPFLPRLGRTIDFLVVSMSTLPLAVWALRRRARGHRRPWWLMLFAMIALNADNVIWYYYTDVLGRDSADGTAADPFASLGHVLLLSSALSILFRRGRNDVGGLIDTTIVSMAVGGMVWDFVLLPHMNAINESTGARLFSFVDVFVLTAILGTLLRLLLTAREVIHALWLLILCLLLSMLGNIIVMLESDPVTGLRPDYTNMIFMVPYVCLGLVSIARSSVLPPRPGPTPADDLTAGRLAYLTGALAAIPVVGGGRQL